jgi:formate hydrogenlyase subunit 3/multisubunit Na+/H+ antiporter MnhD subunit
VQSATGSVLVLIGIALVFSYTGTLKIPELAAMQSARTPVLLAAGAFFLVGYGVKSALVPLHTWLPDAHSQAPSGISAMLSGVVIEAGLIALLRSLGSLGNTSATWGAILLAFGAVNMIVGNLMALRQNQVKRLLAYSSVSHIGYMLLGFGVSLAFQHPQGASGAFFHLFNHALMKGLAFLAAGAMLYGLHIARGEHTPLLVEDLNGASRRYPWAAFTFSIAVLGLGGLPPLAGFMSKWQIFTAGFSIDNVSQNSTVSTLVLLIFIFMALNSVLSLAYYAPLVNRLYRREPSAIVLTGKRLSWTMQLPLMILAAAIVVLGCWPSLLDWLTGPAASSLMASFGI